MTFMKCYRTVCKRDGIHKHTQNGMFYCHGCALKINETNPGLVDISQPALYRNGDSDEADEDATSRS